MKASCGYSGNGEPQIGGTSVKSKLVMCLKRFLNGTPHIGIFQKKVMKTKLWNREITSAIFSARSLAIITELSSSKYMAGCINKDLRGKGFVVV